MPDVAQRFFEDLAERQRVPLLERAQGTVRFELENGGGDKQTWIVGVDRGAVTVTRPDGGEGPSDSVCRVDKAVFERIVTGELNPMAAALRGLLSIEGDPHLFVLVQRYIRGGQS